MDCKKRCKNNLKEYETTHFAEAIVLTCIDYRFVDSVFFFLNDHPRLSQEYDLTTVAGASLGYNQKKYIHWRQTLIDQINLAIDLHHIKQLIVFDHMDCGAYQLFYPDIELNTEEERYLHIKNIKKFIHKLRKIFPKLIYTGYLVHEDGSIENIVLKQ